MDARVATALVIVGANVGWGALYFRRIFRAKHRAGSDAIDQSDTVSASVHIDEALAAPGSAQAHDGSAAEMVKGWAKGRPCVLCGRDVTESRFAGHHIALLEPGGMTREWVDVAADRLALALATSLPVCWNCHVAETFRRMHPELVTDREEQHTRNTGRS